MYTDYNENNDKNKDDNEETDEQAQMRRHRYFFDWMLH